MDAWTEVKIAVNAADVDTAADIAMMVVPYGIYIEDYRDLEKQAKEIAHIDLIDEDLLKQIASETGGKYFRATNNTKLMEIYSEINKMEKSRTIVDSYPQYKELFMRFALLALAAILLEVVMRLFTRHLPD